MTPPGTVATEMAATENGMRDDWNLRLHGVGNASAVELGSAMATIERAGQPWLTIDCGGEGLTAFEREYRAMPRALFMTHAHMDHIAGFERLFVSSWFNSALRGEVRLYVPVTLLTLLHQRVDTRHSTRERGEHSQKLCGKSARATASRNLG